MLLPQPMMTVEMMRVPSPKAIQRWVAPLVPRHFLSKIPQIVLEMIIDGLREGVKRRI